MRSFLRFFRADLERKNADVKAKLDDALFRNQGADNEQDKVSKRARRRFAIRLEV